MFITFAYQLYISMLSVLIPTYNYNVFPLVSLLQKQCEENAIVYEIIVLDDGSKSLLNEANEKINTLPCSTFRSLPNNIGRSAIRNLLAQEAQYEWLLFLDADTLPKDENLIKHYLPYMNNEIKVVYGGIKYQPQQPEDKDLLRWIYGNEREALSPPKRRELPHSRLLTLNFLISKKIFAVVKFNEGIPNLRHEDTLFSYELKMAGIKVEHIENEVYHLGLESSQIFLKKSEESVEGLKYLLDHKLLPYDYIGIATTYRKFKITGFAVLTAFGFKLVKGIFRKNLLGSNPSLFIFDLYRLGYLCSLKKYNMYQLAKKIARKFIGSQQLMKHEVFLRNLYSVFYSGTKNQCTICHKKLRKFSKLHNNDLLCPRCGSLSRDRRLLKLLKEEFLRSGITVLDFSPSRSLARKMKTVPNIKHMSTDLSGNFIADFQFDITNIDVPSETIDLVICYHVLEHITDDRKAMSELYRVLKPSGKALIQTPFKEGDIYEDYSITEPKEREIHFGQDDHVRFYSVSSLKERLEEAGFAVDARSFDADTYYGLAANETVLVLTKA